MSRRNDPPAYPPQEDESSYWATQAWSAEDVQALRAAQARRESRSGETTQNEQLPSEATPRPSKRHPAAQAPPPSVGDVIRHRRARIDQQRTTRAFLLKLVLILAIGYALFTYVFGFAAMKGEQMYPRIRDGDLMFFYRLEDSYTIGDVVTFVRDNTRYTGRVVAKSGDTVNMDETGQLIVNGNIQTEEIFYPTTAGKDTSISFPLTVNGLFLLCDMRTQATDSRQYGAIPMEQIDGKVITILRRRGI